MKNKLAILFTALTLISCGDRSHDDIVNVKPTEKVQPPAPVPTPTPTPTPTPSPVPPKQVVPREAEWRKFKPFETTRHLKRPPFLKGVYYANWENKVEIKLTITDTEMKLETVGDTSRIDTEDKYGTKRFFEKEVNINELGYFQYTTEEHKAAGIDIENVYLEISHGDPVYQDNRDVYLFKGTYRKNGETVVVYNELEQTYNKLIFRTFRKSFGSYSTTAELYFTPNRAPINYESN